MEKCQKWGTNRGRNLTQAEFESMVAELRSIEEWITP
jgi:hypothetical protein